jgi:NAD(P)-dependent dehydrogenase (short-subunit alcohol dehydrogenase family)
VHYNRTDDENVRETVQAIKSLGVDAIPVQADVSQSDGVRAIFDAVQSHFGRLNILVNSASVFHKGALMAMTLEDWQQSLDVNLTGPMLCTQAAVHMLRRNDPPGGAIVNILDYGSVRPWVDRAAHGVSKAALLMLTEISAATLGAENIRVNGVLPGPVMKTPGMSDEQWRQAGEKTALGHPGSADDVARAVAYLVSEDFVTGTILHVNGGEHFN